MDPEILRQYMLDVIRRTAMTTDTIPADATAYRIGDARAMKAAGEADGYGDSAEKAAAEPKAPQPKAPQPSVLDLADEELIKLLDEGK